MGWNDRLDPDAYDWNDPDDVMRAAMDASRQAGAKRKPDPDAPRGECWACGAPNVVLYGSKQQCGSCSIADYY